MSEDFGVEADENVRLDLFLARESGVSRNQAATFIANGCVTVDGRREKASYRLNAGESVRLDRPVITERTISGESIDLKIAYEDDDLLVVDKPAGMVVHPAPGNWSGTLVNALLGRGGQLADTGDPVRAGIVHRLDKETSGLLLVAKNERAHRILGAALSARKIVRRYAVMSWGHLESDKLMIDKPVARDPKDRKRMAVVSTGKSARTEVTRLARFPSTDFLRAHLYSGRTHQIRVHLASVGHPVVGDDVYGGSGGRRTMGLPPRRHFLHAAWLRLIHPATGAELDVRSPLPPDLVASLECINDGALDLGSDPLTTLGFYSADG
jgi:23S rRNA pseudouridine1911/1915/1917 synthase